jgi:hypothetical protein
MLSKKDFGHLSEQDRFKISAVGATLIGEASSADSIVAQRR